MDDYVIAGAGPAGCVPANRLSADPVTSVCVSEAGPKDGFEFIHPGRVRLLHVQREVRLHGRRRPEIPRKIRKSPDVGKPVDGATAHRCVSLGRPKSAVFAAGISAFAAVLRPDSRPSRKCGEKPFFRKDLHYRTLLSPEATEVSHGVHSPTSRIFAAVAGKSLENRKNAGNSGSARRGAPAAGSQAGRFPWRAPIWYIFLIKGQ